VFSSGCHSFWRNDLSQLLFELISGVILFGSMRDPIDEAGFAQLAEACCLIRKMNRISI
jgi:hypothetical protein